MRTVSSCFVSSRVVLFHLDVSFRLTQQSVCALFVESRLLLHSRIIITIASIHMPLNPPCCSTTPDIAQTTRSVPTRKQPRVHSCYVSC